MGRAAATSCQLHFYWFSCKKATRKCFIGSLSVQTFGRWHLQPNPSSPSYPYWLQVSTALRIRPSGSILQLGSFIAHYSSKIWWIPLLLAGIKANICCRLLYIFSQIDQTDSTRIRVWLTTRTIENTLTISLKQLKPSRVEWAQLKR